MERPRHGAYSVGALARFMAEFNAITLEVCAAEGARCYDLAAKLPKDTSVFYDDCHFNTSGARKLALLLGGYLARHLSS